MQSEEEAREALEKSEVEVREPRAPTVVEVCEPRAMLAAGNAVDQRFQALEQVD